MPYELLEENPSPQNESWLGYAGRTGARTLARGGEAVAGLPGDIVNTALSAGHFLHGLVNEGKELPFLPKRLPIGSQDIRENITRPLAGEYLEPQSTGEKVWDDVIGDAATLFVPIKGKVPFAKAALGAVGRSAVGNASKWATEEVTGSPILGTAAKIGSMALAGTLGGRKELNKIKNKSYTDAMDKLPEKIKFDIAPEKAKIDTIIKTISKGDRPDKKFILERLNSVKNITGRGSKAEMKEAIKLKQDWNKYLSDPSLSKASRDSVKQAVGIMNEGISRYGKMHPSFYESYKRGEELTGALNSTNYVQKVLSKHPYLQDSVKNPLVRHMMFAGGFAAARKIGAPATAALAGTALGVREAAKAYQVLSKSPFARRYYKDTIQATLKNDIGAIGRNLAKLDKSFNEFEKKNPGFALEPEESDSRYELID